MSSALGVALGMNDTYTWAQVVSALTGVANNGVLNWSGICTTYTVATGWYSGGTLDSRPSYNRGVTDADNRANGNSVNYQTGYNNGYNAGMRSGTTISSLAYMYANAGSSSGQSITYTAPSAGYYVAIGVGNGTGDKAKRNASITTSGSTISYIQRWITTGSSSPSASQINCRFAVAIHTAYLSAGHNFVIYVQSDYSASSLWIVLKVG